MVKQNKNKALNKVNRALNGYNLPRPRTKIASMNDAGALVSSNFFTPVLTCPALSQLAAELVIAPASNPPTQDAGGAVIGYYQSYRMKRAVAHFTPATGTTTPGVVHMGYIDNPEMIRKWLNGGYVLADRLGIVKSCPIRTSGPVWMSLSLSASMATRMPKYTVNFNLAGLTDADYALQVHGLFIFATEGVPNNANVGVLNMEYSAQGYHLQNLLFSSI